MLGVENVSIKDDENSALFLPKSHDDYCTVEAQRRYLGRLTNTRRTTLFVCPVPTAIGLARCPISREPWWGSAIQSCLDSEEKNIVSSIGVGVRRPKTRCNFRKYNMKRQAGFWGNGLNKTF